MPVIGTAGHVDHGKTALIAALTGIDTDRLPEEKARGMTTDLGFAHFEGGGMTVGVIDVPGHERYIRNMVAGAWGIDGALLVVAADDGWMEQTGRHTEVLRALGTPVLAIVVTKADMVPGSRPAAVAEEVRSRLAAMGSIGSPPLPWIAVDSLRGRGIDELRDLIVSRLAATSFAAASVAAKAPLLQTGILPLPSASLFVDRAFTLPGTGLVAAGSLRGAGLAVGSELVVPRSGERLRVRSLQRYGQSAVSTEIGSRVALTFAKPKAGIHRGDCLATPGDGHFAGSSFYLALQPAHAAWKPRAGLALEICAGTAHRDALAWPAKLPGFVRVAVAESITLALDLPVILLRKGGADIIATGNVFAEGGGTAKERRRIDLALAQPEVAASAGRDGRAAFELALGGCRETDAAWSPPSTAELAGAWAFDRRAWALACGVLAKAAAEPGGFPEAGLASRLGMPRGAAAALLARLVAEGRVRIEGDLIRDGATEAGPALSKIAAALAERLDQAGHAGFNLELDQRPGLRKELEILSRAGRVTSLDGRLFLSTPAYHELAAAVLAGHAPESRLSLGEAKDATGFSRKWIIPLLNRMERDGLVKRQGDERVVLSTELPRTTKVTAEKKLHLG